MARRRSRSVGVLVAVVPALLLACNVLRSLDVCTSDGDCATGETCDPEGRFCLGDTPLVEASAEAEADAPVDAAHEAEAAPKPPCDPSAPFSTFTLVPGFEEREISSARFAPTEITVLFSASNGCQLETCADLFIADRADRSSAFGSGAVVPVVNCPGTSEYWPTISSDGNKLFFESSRDLDGGCTNDLARVWSSTRTSFLNDFDPPKIQSLFAGQPLSESAPYLHPSARSLYFASASRPGKGDFDIFVAKLDSLGIATTVENVDAVNSPAEENIPVVSLDDLALYFERYGEAGSQRDIWISTRPSATASFGAPSLVTEVSSSTSDEYPSWVSDDRCRLYFVSNRPSGGDASGISAYRLWVAERPKFP